MHVAAVCAVDGIRFLAVRCSPDGLWEELGRYVRENSARLWPRDEERVTALLEAGDIRDAVDAYLASIGERWDREHLHIDSVGLG